MQHPVNNQEPEMMEVEVEQHTDDDQTGSISYIF